MIEHATDASILMISNEHLRTILSQGMQCDEPEAKQTARDLINRLVADGNSDLQNLLPGPVLWRSNWVSRLHFAENFLPLALVFRLGDQALIQGGF